MKKLLLTIFVYAVPAIATTVNVSEPKTSCISYAYAILWLVSVLLMSFGVWGKRSDAGFAFATTGAVVFAIAAGTTATTTIAAVFAAVGVFAIIIVAVTLVKEKAFYFGVTAYYMAMAASMTAFLM